MKSIIIYYSYSGNTGKTAAILAEYLKQTSEVRLCELQSLDESRSFFGQAARAFRHKRGVIQETELNLNSYDVVCMGTPVWAFGPAPAMNTYLDRCSGVAGKKVVLFTTYGSGTGKERCMNYMQQILRQKGASEIKRFSIQQGRVSNRDFVLSEIQKAV